jgi:hypothetical protein
MTIIAIAKPFAGTALSTDRKGHQTERTRLAAKETWPPDGHPPPWLSVEERNQLLWGWFSTRGLGGPSERHLRRLFGKSA